MYWRKLTPRGAVAGGTIGLITAIALMILGPTVWVDTLGNDQAIFPYRYPALFSMTLSIASIVAISLLDRGAARVNSKMSFDNLLVRACTGIGSEAAAKH